MTSCQIVRASETGITPAIASATLGCFDSAAVRAKLAGQERRDEVEEADPEEPDEPVHAPGDPAVQAPTCSCASVDRSTFIRWPTSRTHMSRSIRVQVFSTR